MIDLELLQPSICMAAGKPALVVVRVDNRSEDTIELSLGIRGRLAVLAVIEPAKLTLQPAEYRTTQIAFQPGHGPHMPCGPMPYALTAGSMGDGRELAVVFGLVDIHRQRRSPGTGHTCVRDW